MIQSTTVVELVVLTASLRKQGQKPTQLSSAFTIQIFTQELL
jgi:hypothetical protein